MPFPLTDVTGRDLAEIRGLTALTLPPSRVTASGVKWVLDGTRFERGAGLRRPYADRPGWNGRPNWPKSDIAAIVKESLDFKQPLLLHAVGDRTVEIVFKALDRYGAAVAWPSRRVRIEHGDGVVGDSSPARSSWA
jgi:predicted amidohydrolase YtcJ